MSQHPRAKLSCSQLAIQQIGQEKDSKEAIKHYFFFLSLETENERNTEREN